MIRVLVADDSTSVRAVLRRLFARTADLRVVAEAADGAQAVQAVLEHLPQVVLMDLQMPVMDGYAAIERIMALRPTPVVVLSSRANRNQMRTAFEAIRRGAVEVLPKPEDTASWEALADGLPQTVRVAAAARPRPVTEPGRAPARGPAAGRGASDGREAGTGEAAREGWMRWVAIGASTGGPAALRELLEEVPPQPPVSFLVVQHIAAGFEAAMAEWLNKELPLDVRLARDAEVPQPGTVCLAPAGAHLRLARGGVLRLDAEAPARRGHRPSVDELFLSCAECCPRESAGVLLTGMGSDGAEGLAAMRRGGALTMVQDEASSVVFGMPRVALERGAAELALPPRELARLLARGWGRPEAGESRR
jgi:two-component system, chemotaxis family, protein-glutamate methylesterase/glutaminase